MADDVSGDVNGAERERGAQIISRAKETKAQRAERLKRAKNPWSTCRNCGRTRGMVTKLFRMNGSEPICVGGEFIRRATAWESWAGRTAWDAAYLISWRESV